MKTWRVPVQRGGSTRRPAGTIAWDEHMRAWRAYERKWRCGQTAERIAERGGFCRDELTEFLGGEPQTFIEYGKETETDG